MRNTIVARGNRRDPSILELCDAIKNFKTSEHTNNANTYLSFQKNQLVIQQTRSMLKSELGSIVDEDMNQFEDTLLNNSGTISSSNLLYYSWDYAKNFLEQNKRIQNRILTNSVNLKYESKYAPNVLKKQRETPLINNYKNDFQNGNVKSNDGKKSPFFPLIIEKKVLDASDFYHNRKYVTVRQNRSKSLNETNLANYEDNALMIQATPIPTGIEIVPKTANSLMLPDSSSSSSRLPVLPPVKVFDSNTELNGLDTLENNLRYIRSKPSVYSSKSIENFENLYSKKNQKLSPLPLLLPTTRIEDEFDIKQSKEPKYMKQQNSQQIPTAVPNILSNTNPTITLPNGYFNHEISFFNSQSMNNLSVSSSNQNDKDSNKSIRGITAKKMHSRGSRRHVNVWETFEKALDRPHPLTPNPSLYAASDYDIDR